jgi:hypothetical protein
LVLLLWGGGRQERQQSVHPGGDEYAAVARRGQAAHCCSRHCQPGSSAADTGPGSPHD